MKKIVQEHFKTLNILMDTMQERPSNAAFKEREQKLLQDNRVLSSQKLEFESNGHWTGTRTYTEAMEVMKTGYHEPLEKMKKAILKIGEKNKAEKAKIKKDYAGYKPNVPAAIMGLPKTMYSKKKLPNKVKTIHLNYSFCASADINIDQIIKGGINFISLVNLLEKQGYRIKIDVMFITQVSKTVAAYSVSLKDYGQPLNLLKLAFPLVHPGMLRRVSFKWLETTPGLKDKEFANRGYGQPLGTAMGNDGRKEVEFLKKNGIIKGENSFYCNVYDAFKAHNIEELAQRMGIIK